MLELNNLSGAASVKVYDVNGQELPSCTIIAKNGVNLINTAKLPNGLYVIRITDETGGLIKTVKFSKVD